MSHRQNLHFLLGELIKRKEGAEVSIKMIDGEMIARLRVPTKKEGKSWKVLQVFKLNFKEQSLVPFPLVNYTTEWDETTQQYQQVFPVKYLFRDKHQQEAGVSHLFEDKDKKPRRTNAHPWSNPRPRRKSTGRKRIKKDAESIATALEGFDFESPFEGDDIFALFDEESKDE